MLTESDKGTMPTWFVIGHLPNGDQTILYSAWEEHRAECVAERFRTMLEGYREIVVERCGDCQADDCQEYLERT